MEVAVIDYGAGNVQSVLFALSRIGVAADAFALTADAEVIRSAKRVIFPGQGEAGSTMRNLRAAGLDTLIPKLTQPVLGICIGQQLLCAHSEENDTNCLGVFPAQVRRFPAAAGKVPQVGWNRLQDTRGPLLQGLQGQFVYFVHSYYVTPSEYDTARADYGLAFSAAMARDNFHAVQFHPEKSGAAGAEILRRFMALA